MQNFTLFQNFADACLKNDPFYLISKIRASHCKNTPFLAKMDTRMVYALVGSGGRALELRLLCIKSMQYKICSKRIRTHVY